MRLAVLSDIHLVGPAELALAEDGYGRIRRHPDPIERFWRQGLYHVRRRFWNGHLRWRHTAFLRAMDEVAARQPDWVIVNGDYGGDLGGVGLSHRATLDSARLVVEQLRHRFPGKCRFVFGDHDIGKYSTTLREGGIRLASLEAGERDLRIPSFWHDKAPGGFHLIGINSSLLTLDFFLPEALEEEVPEWHRRRAEHLREVAESFESLPREARVILFCHDPSALAVLAGLPVIQRRLTQIEMTVVGHLHSPTLLRVARYAARLSGLRPRYPVARIVAKGLEGARSWAQFKPVVCPSTFGTGHHVAGGLLWIEPNDEGRLVAQRVRVHRRHYSRHKASKGRA
ncbi:MAG: metallophosphoesterase [Kiritimatiellae bacterium]|nr:metallophosphoesterase [Kiritimatiellia bacterium]MDW8458729.1 metallophosphoesterase [Verrucomicrobiota bacterium]